MTATTADSHLTDCTPTHEGRGPSASLTVIYGAHGYNGPYTDLMRHPMGELIVANGGTRVIRLCSDLVVKYGAYVKVEEAETLMFLEEKAPGISAPRLHACYTMGPFNRDPDDFGSVYDTYIVMTYIEGKSLSGVWSSTDGDCKRSIAAQLQGHLRELRSVKPEKEFEIRSVSDGRLLDPVFDYHTTQGPFANEADFNAALVAIHEKTMHKAQLEPLIKGALAQNTHKVVLTHGDLHGRNILIDGDRVVGLLDWETCGWYPEYWEFVKCFKALPWPKGWPEFVLQTLSPHYHEWAVYDLVTRHVW